MKTSLLLICVLGYIAVCQARSKQTACQKAQSQEGWKPACDDNGKYVKKQCNAEKCFCVKAKKGKEAFGGQDVPLGESYDCKSKPKSCQKARFSAIFDGADAVPECDENGLYSPMQCKQVPKGASDEDVVMNMQVDNTFKAFVDGSEVGSGANWVKTDTIQAGKGAQVIGIFATNTGGPAAMIFSTNTGIISSPAIKCIAVTNLQQANADYAGWMGANFDDSEWPNAKGFGAMGVGPWLKKAGSEAIAANANWIWTQANSDAIICRVNLIEKNIALGQPAFQTSTGWNGPASLAVDGKATSTYRSGSCTHTHNVENPFWAVDLGEERDISKVVITNRGDCCSDRLGDVYIAVTDQSPADVAPTFDNVDVIGVDSGAWGAGETRAIPCSGKGRYLVVMMKRKNYLTLCEVQVYERPVQEECWCVKTKNGKEIKESRTVGKADC